jgi:hypothetical protein
MALMRLESALTFVAAKARLPFSKQLPSIV